VKRKPLLWTAAVVVVIATAAGTVVIMRQRGDGVAVAATAPATGTAKVVRTDLSTRVPMFGTLGFSAPVTIAGTTAGQSYTWLPVPGAIIAQGQPLYEVDGRQVPLLSGDRPAWRPLAEGATAGPDIAQLNTALVALGFAHGLTGNQHFTSATTAAVRRFQHARGVTVTGRIELGDVVFGPAPIRVQALRAQLGTPAQPGAPMLIATSTDRVVSLAVPVDRAYLLHVSDPVTVTLPDAHTTTPGTVSAVSPVATAAGEEQGSRPPQSTVDVSVALSDPGKVSAYTTAPVSVDVTTRSVLGVLAVPVTALLAAPHGGFDVVVLDNGARHEVAVTPGLYADTLVEVSGSGIAEGTTVEVPAP
jgi:peptidoglycan hydrolase-like protein with peptidoglycan-binding domain